MLIRRLKENSIELVEIEPIEAELLRKVPSVCDSGGDSRSETRLFSSPADTSERQFLNDWDEYVRPGLRHLFLSARNTVKAGSGKPVGSSWPPRSAHCSACAWRRLAERPESGPIDPCHQVQFHRRELSMHEAPKWFSRRDLVLQQINFYAEIQERIIDAIEDK